MSTPARPVLWTISADYFATGEGRTFMAVIGYATSEEAAKKLFQDQFGDWFAQGCEAVAGVVQNPVTQFLFSTEALQMLTKHNGNANLVVHASIHINMS